MTDVNLRNLARMTVSSSGTGTISLNAAVTGFLTFDLAGCSTAAAGEVVRYAVNDTTASEIAYGTYFSSGPSLTRGSSANGMKSTNTDAPINMSNAAQVFITPQDRDFPWIVDSGNASMASALAMSANFGGLGGNPIHGTNTNDDAAPGYVGEVISSTVSSDSAVNVPAATSTFVTSIALTQGDWDVSGSVHFLPANTTSVTYTFGSISESTSIVATPGRQAGGRLVYTGDGIFTNIVTLPAFRVSVSSTAPISGLVETLIAFAGFTVSTCTAWGFIQARRRR